MFPERSPLGHLRIVEVYVFHDGPKLFLAANEADQLFLGLWADFDDETETWLYAPVSARRLEVLRAAQADVRDVFADNETAHVWLGRWSPSQRTWSVDTVLSEAIGPELLPDPGYRLSPTLADPNADAKEADLRAMSERLRRDVLLLSLRFKRRYTVEAPVRELGAFLGTWQEQLDVLGQARRGKFGRGQSVLPEVLDQTEMLADSTFPGSFGLRLVAAMPADLAGESLVSLSIQDAMELFEAGEDALRALLRERHPRIATKFRRLLTALLDTDAGLGLVWQRPTAPKPRRLFVSVEHAQMALAVVSEVDDEVIDVVHVEGVLTGVNIRTKTYEIVSTVDKKRYAGKILPSAMGVAAHATVSERYRAKIHLVTEAETATGVEKTQSMLAELSQI